MANPTYGLSSQFSNDLIDRKRRRQEKRANWTDRETGVISGGMTVMSMIMTVANMVMFAWFFLQLGRTSGLTLGVDVFGVDAMHIFMAAMGLSLGWMATGSILDIVEANGIWAKALAVALCVALLVGSLGTSGLFNLSFFEAGKMRAEAAQAVGDTQSSRRDIVQAAVDREGQALDIAAKNVTTAQASLEAADRAVASAREAGTSALRSAEADIRDAEDALRSWFEGVVAEHGATSAAANRRSRSDHPERVNKVAAIERAKAALQQTKAVHIDALAQAMAMQTQSASRRATAQTAFDAQRSVLASAQASLDAAIASGQSDDVQADVFVRTANSFAPMLGMNSGASFLAAGAIFFAILSSLAPALQTFISKSRSDPALKDAERHRAFQQAMRVADTASAPVPAAPVAAVAPAPDPSPPVAPVAAPAPSAVADDPDTLIRLYASKVADAVADAENGLLGDKDATFRTLKERYSCNDAGAKAIRYGLVKNGLAIFDGDKCRVTV